MTLLTDLQAAGLPVVSAPDPKNVTFSRPLTAPELVTYQNVIFPPGTPDYLRNNARATIAALPNWATWSQSDLTTWWNTNLADSIVDAMTGVPVATRTLLKNQNAAILREGQMLIALRDYLFDGMALGQADTFSLIRPV